VRNGLLARVGSGPRSSPESAKRSVQAAECIRALGADKGAAAPENPAGGLQTPSEAPRSTSMKIALVTMQLGPEYSHGTERYIESLGSALCDRGHDVLFVAGDPQGHTEHALGTPRGTWKPAQHASGPSRLLEHPVRGWLTVEGPVSEAQAWLARERPDIVHLANPAHIGVAMALAAEPLGIPVVATAMDFWWICPRATLLRDGARLCDGTPGWQDCLRCVSSDHPRRALRPLARVPNALADLSLFVYGTAAAVRQRARDESSVWKRRRAVLRDLLNRIDGIIFPSPATRDAIVPSLEHERWRVIPYGLGPEWFEDPRPARTGGAAPAPNELTLGYAGSMQHHKGPHLLLDAVRQLGWQETRVRFAGALDTGSSYGRSLERAASGLNVEFAGLLGPPEMRTFLRSLDVLAVTSIWPENLPFVLLEGLAAGVPVVASDVNGIAHCIRDERLLFEPGDATGLATALRAASQHSEPPGATLSTLSEMTDATLEVYDRARNRRG
jgi:glycosyltransferase involved in cell wall biosynthesis